MVWSDGDEIGQKCLLTFIDGVGRLGNVAAVVKVVACVLTGE